MGSKQLTFTFKWQMTDFTNRTVLEGWQQNATQLTLVDLEYTGGKTVYLESYQIREIPGVPGILDVTLSVLEKA